MVTWSEERNQKQGLPYEGIPKRWRLLVHCLDLIRLELIQYPTTLRPECIWSLVWMRCWNDFFGIWTVVFQFRATTLRLCLVCITLGCHFAFHFILRTVCSLLTKIQFCLRLTCLTHSGVNSINKTFQVCGTGELLPPLIEILGSWLTCLRALDV